MMRITGPHGTARTATTGKLTPSAGANLERRWGNAVAAPRDWRELQLAYAAHSTNRTPDAVLTAWGLAHDGIATIAQEVAA